MNGGVIRYGLTVVSMFLLLTSAEAQFSNLKFENYSTSEGLSSSTCLEVFQDSRGFLWFGTIDGLNKYDGYSFKIFRPILNDNTSLSNNRVSCIEEDRYGNLWVGTENGLNVYKRDQGSFQRIELYNRKSNSANARDIINDVTYDENENAIWVATKNGASMASLDVLENGNFEELNFNHFANSLENENSLDDNDVSRIKLDIHGEVWIVTAGGYINKYKTQKRCFERIAINDKRDQKLDHLPKSLLLDKSGKTWVGNDLSNLWCLDGSGDFKRLNIVDENIAIYDICQDSYERIWIATSNKGIYVLDPLGNLLTNISHDIDDPFSLPNNQSSRIFQDKDGIFWIATYNQGVTKLDMSKSSFGHYFYKNDQESNIKITQSVIQDLKGNIWVGTDGAGLNLFDENKDSFRLYKHDANDVNSLSSDKILYLEESYDGNIWVCTLDGGLNKFYPKTGRFKRYKHDDSNPNSIGQNSVWVAAEDDSHRVWIGTQEAGLNVLNPETNEFRHYTNNPNDPTSIIGDFVFSLLVDSKGRLLIGTSIGMCWLDLKSDFKEEIEFRQVEEKNITGNRVNHLFEDHNGDIWVGSDFGLHHLSEDLKLIRTYSTKDGMPSNLVLGLEEDSRHDLWVTTKSGMCRFDPKLSIFENFNINDGLQGMEFQSKSITKLQDGRILAGGINGFNLFDPLKIGGPEGTFLEFGPMITELKLLNRTIYVGDEVNGRVVLKKPFDQSEGIVLKHDEGYITVEFVALHFHNQQLVKYAYKLHGADKGFVFSGSNKMANYSGLPPGNYQFEVKASLNGNWDEAQKTIFSISVLPPPWKTWWAYVIYVLFVGVIIWGVFKYYNKMINEERNHELDQMKLQFFMNVSHEFRTPLTLILNPVDKIISSFNDPEIVKNSAYTIQRSARKLLNLVNQLLDFRKMDLGKAPLDPFKGDVVSFAKDIVNLFDDLAKEKSIELSFESELETFYFWFDPDKMEKIITNLLSNALKFTLPDGSIKVYLAHIIKKSLDPVLINGKVCTSFIEIIVEDTGIGLKKEHKSAVFERFFHIDSTNSGTGIGLNFTKSLVEQHDGEILVESEHGEGSKFIIRMPFESKQIHNALRSNKEVRRNIKDFDPNSIRSLEYELAISDIGGIEDKDHVIVEGEDTVRFTALIVEDNKELREHLKNELRNQFKIREASNGREGLEKAIKFCPDIIVSDVMMPEMDGFEMCVQLKTNKDTCHIPIVLLTARSLEEDRIEGYTIGADAYLPKPFNVNVLRARIKNLLDSKQRLKDKFISQTGIIASNELATNSLDEKFLDDVTRIILENVGDSDFGLEQVIAEIGMSRSQFYRKVNSLTGQNPSNFIRTIRLKHAAELLKNRTGSIKEIAYKSGFNSTAYFSKTFKELFGKTPNEFAESTPE